MNRAVYEKNICDRMPRAETIPFCQANKKDGGPSRPNECHENVDAWVKDHPGYKAIRGWVTDAHFSDNSIRLTAHSVVQNADGKLFDITPLNNECLRGHMRFVRHLGDEASFAIERRRNIYITCRCVGEVI